MQPPVLSNKDKVAYKAKNKKNNHIIGLLIIET